MKIDQATFNMNLIDVPQEGVDRLNAALALAPATVKSLLLCRVPCPDALEPLVYHQEDAHGKWLTVLGLLNATLFKDTARLGRVVPQTGDFQAQYDGLTGFCQWIPNAPTTEVTP